MGKIWGGGQAFGIKRFYTTRAFRLLYPQWIGFFSAFALTYMIDRNVFDWAIQNKLGFLISFCGMNYAGNLWEVFGIQTVWLIGEWFTSVILTIYLLFPLLRCLFIRHRWMGTVLLFVLFAVNLQERILTDVSGCFSYSNGIMLFWTGMIFGEYREKLKDKLYSGYGYCLMFMGLILAMVSVIGYVSVYIFCVLLFVLLYRLSYSFCFTRYVCEYNYEIYLVHHRIYLLIMPFWLGSHSNGMQIFCAFLTVFGLSLATAKYLQFGAKKAEKMFAGLQQVLKIG